MPKVSAEHTEARKRQILEGAQRAFARHGYEGATVAKLEEETGLSRGAIFNYFGSKQDLFIELALETSRRYGLLIVERGLDAAVRAMAEEDPAWLGVLLEMAGAAPPQPRVHAKRWRRPARRERRGSSIGSRRGRRTAPSATTSAPSSSAASRPSSLNGFALRVLGGDQTDVDALLRLLHDALAPRK